MEQQPEETDLEVYQPSGEIILSDNDPMAEVDRGQRQAQALMSILENNQDATLFADINGKKYLRVEGWELIGRFNKINAIVDYVHEIVEEGKLIGYEAKVDLMQDGQRKASATSLCGLDEWVCKGKTGLAQRNTCMSMAQTRGVSKAYRLNFSWIAVLAGFQPTPAEEMQGQQQSRDPSLMCPIHKTEWFKTPKMRAYAHKPSKAGDRWCNMDDVKADEEVAGERSQTGDDEMEQYMSQDDEAYQQHLREIGDEGPPR